MKRESPHPALTRFRLCKEFGWTLGELERQPAKAIEEFLVIIDEIDRQTMEEVEKARRQSPHRARI
jgi:hypothetical protein